MSFLEGGLIESIASTPASSRGVTITSAAGFYSYGTVVELIASTPFDANWVSVQIGNSSSGTISHFYVDIMVGASTESVLIPGLLSRTREVAGGGVAYLLPVFIPKGSRISARGAANGGALSVDVAVQLIAGTALSGGVKGVVSRYPPTSEVSIGILVDPGGTANTDSAWVQVTNSTARDHSLLILFIGNNYGFLPAITWLVDIAVGASSAEEPIIEDLLVSSGSTTDVPSPQVIMMPVRIPKGTRITARARCSSVDSDARKLNITAFGV